MMRRLLVRPGALRAPALAPRLLAPLQAARSYSIQPKGASTSQLLDIEPSKLIISETGTPCDLKKPEELVFGRTFTGKMNMATQRRMSH